MVGIVIAHYSSSGRLAKHLVNLIQELSKYSKNIIFVSTGILESELSKLAPYATVIARENTGYDFWSYKVGLEELGDLSRFQKVVCFNSSFICLKPDLLLERAFSSASRRGMTTKVPEMTSLTEDPYTDASSGCDDSDEESAPIAAF